MTKTPHEESGAVRAKPWSEWIAKIILAGFAVAIASTLGFFRNTLDWKEEIVLHDGRIVVVEREDRLGGWAEPGQKASQRERRISFSDPDDPKKRYTHVITGSSNYLLIGFNQATPWVIVSVGPFSNDTKCPIGTYETFRWLNGTWHSVSYATLPPVFKKPNMAVSYTVNAPDPRRSGRLLKVDEVQKILDDMFKIPMPEEARSLVQKDANGKPIDCHYYKPSSSARGES